MPDCDFNRGEPPLTVEQVHDFAQDYETYRLVDSEHEFTKTGRKRGYKKESYILESDKSFELFDGSTQTYPRGTWMMTSHITDPEAIQKAYNGEYSGYSPTVRSRRTADLYLEALKSEDYEEAEALKSRSLSGLIKDIPDPVVLSVSLVKKPCQTGSKLCKINKDGERMTDDSKILDKIRNILGDAENAEVEALKSQVDSLESIVEEMKADNAEALKSMKEELVESFKDTISESLKEFADKSKEEEEEEGEEEETNSEESEEEETSTQDEEEEEEEEKEEDDKGSKQGKTHNNKADKSQEDLDTYSFLGRNPDGTRKNY